MTDPTPPGGATSSARDPLYSAPDAWSPSTPLTPPAAAASGYVPPTYPISGAATPTGFDPYTPAGAYGGPIYQPPPGPYGTQPTGPYGAPAAGPYGAPPVGPYGYAYDFGYATPYGAGFAPPPQPTDGLAVASLVLSCVSVVGLCASGIASLLGVVGAIFGHVARRRIRNTGAGGGGMALAGIIVGWVMAAIGVLMLTVFIVMAVNDGFSD